MYLGRLDARGIGGGGLVGGSTTSCARTISASHRRGSGKVYSLERVPRPDISIKLVGWGE